MFIVDLEKIDDLLDHLDRDVENRVYTRFRGPRLGDGNVFRFAAGPAIQQESDAEHFVRVVVVHLVEARPLVGASVSVVPDDEDRFHHFSRFLSRLNTGA